MIKISDSCFKHNLAVVKFIARSFLGKYSLHMRGCVCVCLCLVKCDDQVADLLAEQTHLTYKYLSSVSDASHLHSLVQQHVHIN